MELKVYGGVILDYHLHAIVAGPDVRLKELQLGRAASPEKRT
ncbi:MAG TPA: hypothetical protein VIT00_09655 [Terrimicrobiaceae bacterium]